MQRAQDWGDVFTPASAGHDPGCHILHPLQPRNLCLGDAKKKRENKIKK